MAQVKVGIAGYGIIGQQLADGVARQQDMELVGVADTTPALSVRTMMEKGMPCRFFNAISENEEKLQEVGVPISGSFEDLVSEVDIMLDTTSVDAGIQNKEVYRRLGKKAIFQGGEKNDVAEELFHGYANYEKGIGKQFLKLTSCNTTGLIRAVDCLDRAVGVNRVAITIIQRVSDSGDYNQGSTNTLQVVSTPSHQDIDLMTIMPHVDTNGILVHMPVTYGPIIVVVADAKKKVDKTTLLEMVSGHPRIRTVSLVDGFLESASLFRYTWDLEYSRGDMYKIVMWDESIVMSGDDIMFAINIPNESVVVPENIDAIRAAMEMQTDRLEGVAMTNRYLGLKKIG